MHSFQFSLVIGLREIDVVFILPRILLSVGFKCMPVTGFRFFLTLIVNRDICYILLEFSMETE